MQLESVLQELANVLPDEQLNRLLDAIETELNAPQANASEISELNSIISEQQNELRKKSQTIVSLNEKIEKLSKSDLELKQSKENMQEVERLNGQLAAKERELTRTQNELARMQEQLEDEKKEVDALSKVAHSKIRNADKNAREEGKKQAEKMQSDFVLKWGAWLYIIAAYGFFVTALEAFSSNAFRWHFKTFWATLWQWFNNFTDALDKWTYGLSTGIQNPIGAGAVHWGLAILLMLIPLAIIVVGLALWFVWFKNNQADKVAATFALFSFGIITYRAYAIYERGWNAVLEWIVFQVAFMVVRAILDMEYSDHYGRKITVGKRLLDLLPFKKSSK